MEFSNTFGVDDNLNLEEVANHNDSVEREKKNLRKMEFSNTFGVDDNLNLEVLDLTDSSVSKNTDSPSVNKNQIRGLKDENGRLSQLLREKEFEIRQLQKGLSTQSDSIKLPEFTNDTAAMKIVELSKKLRKAVSDLEVEKTKSRCLAKKYEVLKQEGKDITQEPKDITDLEEEIKQLQGKLKQTESKMNEWRNQSQVFKQELKLANKVISQEVGESANIHALLSESSSWKGRAQQNLTLQQKVSELKQQLKQYQNKATGKNNPDGESNVSEANISEQNSSNQALRQLIKSRKENQEKMEIELKNAQENYANIKTKCDCLKARNQILSNETKVNKQQIQVLLEKGKRDEELIETLMNQHGRMKEMIENNIRVSKPESLHQQMGEMVVKKQNNDNLVNQLKMIIEEKDKKLKLLEDQMNQSLFQECPSCNLTFENANCGSAIINTGENCNEEFSQMSEATPIQSDINNQDF
ncbi:Hypothetical predicted protein [Octopus vulgaris]|uniref:Coiled-coil domain-containing protein 13-like n=1 Tax=Octopus vulgaris TaxID=6645 RepID=A0AA36F041_OCTVU|nr:Hypothetical predicted protein [Octopus vulgaris]